MSGHGMVRCRKGGGGGGGGGVTCNYCKEPGHKIPDCPKLKQKEKAGAAYQQRPSHRCSSSATPDVVKRRRFSELIANHFRMIIDDVAVYQYRIDIKPLNSLPHPEYATIAGGDTSEAKIRRQKQKENRNIFNYFVANTPEIFGEAINYTVYDGDCIIITAKELSQKKVDKTMELGLYRRTYKISVQFTEQIDLSAINLYYEGKTREVPRNAIKAIEIILNTANRIPFGKSLYPKDNDIRSKDFIDRNNTKYESYGHNQSVHLSQDGPTLNADRNATAFYISGNLLDIISKLSPNLLKDTRLLSNQLKGLRVYIDHFLYKRYYTIKAVHNKPPSETFISEKRTTGKISVKEYYKFKYGKDLNDRLPCIIPKNGRNSYLPLEFCSFEIWL